MNHSLYIEDKGAIVSYTLSLSRVIVVIIIMHTASVSLILFFPPQNEMIS